ncbi:MAG: hypothetical protein NC123_15540 [Butyrivibrio sp.]|nr:hypothetical protein [Acetatifactor muris]MCM1560932.1 hypothetical protein [Butyrivibrio sp.]
MRYEELLIVLIVVTAAAIITSVTCCNERKKWNELNQKRQFIEDAYRMKLPVFPQKGIQIISYYANSEMYLKELCICVSARDWYLLEKEPFFQELVRYVEGLEK